MCLVGGIRTATKSKGNIGVFQTDSLSTEPSMLIPSNAQNSYLIYSVCRLLLKRNCSNVLNTLFRNKAVVNLATRALVTYIDHLTTITSILENRKAVKKSTFVAFVDFSKVYDTINRELLWTKLATYGIDGEMF